ncbi:hypothetical protein [Aliihoeflea aestuarii]|nr:hypothetical protein [Aliihoeflea aestuarii]
MTAVRAALITLSMLSGILLWGAGIYAADAAGDQVVDGYGVVASE